jgi:hypothetical protein
LLTNRGNFESQPTAEQLRLGDADHSLLRPWAKHFAKKMTPTTGFRFIDYLPRIEKVGLADVKVAKTGKIHILYGYEAEQEFGLASME